MSQATVLQTVACEDLETVECNASSCCSSDCGVIPQAAVLQTGVNPQAAVLETVV